MFYQDVIFFVREIACRAVLKESSRAQNIQECFLNPPCGCSNPGKELQCEDCPHLEACLSQFKPLRSSASHIKVPVTTNTRI